MASEQMLNKKTSQQFSFTNIKQAATSHSWHQSTTYRRGLFHAWNSHRQSSHPPWALWIGQGKNSDQATNIAREEERERKRKRERERGREREREGEKRLTGVHAESFVSDKKKIRQLPNGSRANYVIESIVHWKPLRLATQFYLQNDWLGGIFSSRMSRGGCYGMTNADWLISPPAAQILPGLLRERVRMAKIKETERVRIPSLPAFFL